MPKFHVHRETIIDAPCEQVFDRVADFSSWSSWSPWLIADPDARVDVSDNSNSVGSTYHWTGESSGEGEMKHEVLKSPRRIQSEIRFIKPMRSVSEVSFDLEPAGEGTRIRWNMDGSLPWLLFWMTSSMDAYIGNDYERGLRMLKEWIETGKVESQLDISGASSAPAMRIAGIREACNMTEIGPIMERAICTAGETLQAAGVELCGPAASAYHQADIKHGHIDFTAGFEIPADAELPAGLVEWSTPGGPAFHVRHTGGYHHVGNAWSAAYQHVRYKKIKLNKKAATFEVYRNSPDETASADLITDIYLPLRS